MNFFDQLGKKVTDAGKGVAQQTKNLSEIARLTSVIDTEEKLVAQSYAQIGKAYYENHKNDPSAECASQIALVNKSLEKIAQWREQIQKIKGIVKCPQCGADVPYNSQFCGTCGSRIVRPSPAPRNAPVRYCPSCGTEAAATDRFCNKCGTPIPLDSQAPVRPQPVQPNAPSAPALPKIALSDEAFDVSEAPVSVEEPAVPETPVFAEEPVIPETPVFAEEPAVPETPVFTEEPVVPETPVFAKEPVIPETPAAPEAPEVLPLKPRFCQNCGAEAEDGDRFCNKCGKPLF